MQADMWNPIGGKTNFASMLESNPQALQVAEVDNQAVGLIIIDQHERETTFFYRLAVDTNFHERGVGTALLQKAEENAQNNGTKEIALYMLTQRMDNCSNSIQQKVT